MKRQSIALILAVSFFMAIPASGQTQSSSDPIKLEPNAQKVDFAPDVVLVRFKDELPVNPQSAAKLSKVGATSVDAIFQKYQVTSVAQLFKDAKSFQQKQMLKSFNGKTFERASLHNIYKLNIKDGTRLFETIDALKNDPNVIYAEPNYIYSIVVDKPVSGILTPTDVEKLASEKTRTAFSPQSINVVTPNDPLYSQQWYIPAVHADAVWDSTQGDTSQVIAFLDTGVDWHHPDLAENIWTNTAEANGITGVDDDHDGFVDDIHGWDFINNDNDPSDDNGHGTHVAGIACAVGNNGIGIAGVNWHARIMPIKVFQSSGRGDAATISQGINYAANKGATVINMSFGSYARSLTMEAALTNAYASCVLVAAAGNDGLCIGPAKCSDMRTGQPFYPAALSYILGVQAGDAMGPEGFSNYDPDGPIFSGYSDLLNYELKSPGSGIISTIPNGNYRAYSGTSMAAPIISGAVSLYKAIFPEHSQEIMWGNLVNTMGAHIDLFSALSTKGNPKLSVVSSMIIDTLDGNRNGLVNAGETIELWFAVKNFWSKAESVYVGIEFNEFEDTSTAQILIPTAFIGSISSYAKRSNENSPLKIHISSTVANNRDIVFNVLTWSAGLVDTNKHRVVLNIVNGIELSGFQQGLITLNKNKSYLVTSNFAVDSLIIEPGTIVKLFPNTSIFVIKYLLAEGNQNDKIIFSGDQSGYWNHIKVLDGSPVAKHCIFEGSKGYAYDGSSIATGFSAFEDCIFRNNVGDLFWYSPSIFHRCIFTENHAPGMNLWINGPSFLDNLVVRNHDAYIAAVVFTSDLLSRAHGNSIFGNVPYDISASNVPWGAYALGANYYGTVRKSKISAHIIDFFDSPYYPILVLDSALVQPSPAAHGHIWKVLFDNIDPQDDHLDPIGVGPHRLDVYFNRPMDTTNTPLLSFGVREPFTQQSVVDSGRWSPDHRIWTAYKNIKLYTGDGINRVRVAAARDLDGFEIPVEDMRFEFLIDAAGSASTDFVATPGLGKINLEWNNAGLVDFLGFNMYRFTNKTDTTYTDTTLINTKLITDTLYTDFGVVPGKKYYYLYKVVRTDFSESNFSRVAGTTALTSSPGDANGDLAVNVLDVVSVISYILGQNPQPFIFAAADINHDSTINVLDVVGIINVILHPGGSSVVAQSKIAEGVARLDLSGNSIILSSSVPVSAVQFRLQGKGLKDLQFTPDPSIAQFEAANNPLGDSARVFVIYNLTGTTLGTGNHALGRFSTLPPLVGLTDGIVADANGKKIVTSIYENGQPLIPDVYYLSQNFPNPFNMSTRIQFGIPTITKAKIVLYNVLGQRVRTYDLGERVPGRYEITWNGEDERGITVSSGIYFYRFESDKFTLAKKLVLIK